MERNAPSPSGKPQATARLRLTKTGPARFMSHLDFIRAVERAVRRAELPVALTEGFHPHPRMSFSPALPVGVESECELVDVDLREIPGAGEVAGRLERALPPGMRLVSCMLLPPGGPSLSSVIRAASYQVDFGRDKVAGRPETIKAAVEGLLRADAIPVSRTTPRGSREFNLRPLIYDLRFLREDGAASASVHMLVAAGSRGHVRPDDVARELARRAGLGPGARPARIVRKEFYVERDGRFHPLL